jgi:hypothetical protein
MNHSIAMADKIFTVIGFSLWRMLTLRSSYFGCRCCSCEQERFCCSDGCVCKSLSMEEWIWSYHKIDDRLNIVWVNSSTQLSQLVWSECSIGTTAIYVEHPEKVCFWLSKLFEISSGCTPINYYYEQDCVIFTISSHDDDAHYRLVLQDNSRNSVLSLPAFGIERSIDWWLAERLRSSRARRETMDERCLSLATDSTQ